MAEGLYPKADGQVYYAKDANMAYYQSALAGSMWMTSINVTSGAATQLKAGNASRKSILLYNFGAITAYVGLTGVTSSGTTSGYPLPVGKSIYLNNKEAIYAATLTGSTDIRFLETE